MNSICVLLATKNASAYLEEFLYSLLKQDYPISYLLISDDNSNDTTLSIINRVLEGKINYRIISGPDEGSTANFYHLLRTTEDFDFYAFADQDDVWKTHHLSRAVKLMSIEKSIPILTTSQTSFKKFNVPNLHSLKQLDISNLLLNNPTRGCTFVFNKLAKDVFSGANWNGVQFHDWWTAFLCSVFGKVYYFIEPSVVYRVHPDQQIGPQEGLHFLMKKILNFKFSLQESILMCDLAVKKRFFICENTKSKLELWKTLENINFIGRYRVLIRTKPRANSWFKTVFAHFYILFFLNIKNLA